jgi:hypothetical protein
VDTTASGSGHVQTFKFKLMSAYPLHGVFWFFINKSYLQPNSTSNFWSRDHFNYTIARIPNWYEAPPSNDNGGQLWNLQEDYRSGTTDEAAFVNPQFEYYMDVNQSDTSSSPIQDVSILSTNTSPIELPSTPDLHIGTVTYFNYVQRLLKDAGYSSAPVSMYIFDDNVSQNYITSSTNVSIMKGEKEYYIVNKFGDFYNYVKNSQYVLYYYNIEYKQFKFQNGTMAVTNPV